MENNKKVCTYNKAMHSTEESKKYHIDKCVMKTMTKMGDKQQCMKYMSGVMNANNSSKSCSIKDIEDICEDHKKKFTMSDAVKLCTVKNNATSQFWKQKNMPKLAEQNIMTAQSEQNMMTGQSEQNMMTGQTEQNMMPEQSMQSTNWLEESKINAPQGNQEGTWLEKARQM